MPGSSVAVVEADVTPTAAMLQAGLAPPDQDALRDAIRERIGAGRVAFIASKHIADVAFGDAVAAVGLVHPEIGDRDGDVLAGRHLRVGHQLRELRDREAMLRERRAACVHDAREVRVARLEVRVRGVLRCCAHLALSGGQCLCQLSDVLALVHPSSFAGGVDDPTPT